MLYSDQVVLDQNSATLYLGPTQQIQCNKYALKDKITRAAVRRIGSPRVVAFTRGVYEAEDTVLEMDAMTFYGVFLPALGATEISPLVLSGGDAEFELTETIAAPGPLGEVLGAVTNIAKGCQIAGFEKSTEATEAATMVSVTIKIREIVWGKTNRGGAGISLAT